MKMENGLVIPVVPDLISQTKFSVAVFGYISSRLCPSELPRENIKPSVKFGTQL